MRFSYQTEQRVPHQVDEVFRFFANPANLPLLMPAWQHAHIDHQSLLPPPPGPDSAAAENEVAGEGSQITLSFRPFPGSPIRLSWEAKIAEFVWNEHFCDAQIRGPFAYWKHCHYIRSVDWGGTEATLVADHVEYEMPFGLAGGIAHRLFLRRQIERTFTFRQSQLARLLTRGLPKAQTSIR